MVDPSIIIGVIGASSSDPDIEDLAERVGELIAKRGAALVCGGLGGVMEAASRGARRNGGVTIGVLPGADRDECNRHITYPIVTDLGHARNVIIAHTAQALIAVAGEYGTLSEIAVALKLGKTVAVLGKWGDIEGTIKVSSPEQAVEVVFSALAKSD